MRCDKMIDDLYVSYEKASFVVFEEGPNGIIVDIFPVGCGMSGDIDEAIANLICSKYKGIWYINFNWRNLSKDEEIITLGSSIQNGKSKCCYITYKDFPYFGYYDQAKEYLDKLTYQMQICKDTEDYIRDYIEKELI